MAEPDTSPEVSPSHLADAPPVPDELTEKAVGAPEDASTVPAAANAAGAEPPADKEGDENKNPARPDSRGSQGGAGSSHHSDEEEDEPGEDAVPQRRAVDYWVFSPPGPRMKMDVELENVEVGYEHENFERHDRRGVGVSNRALTLANALKYICKRLHLLDSVSEDVEVLMRPKFPKPDKLQLMQARTLLPEYLLERVNSKEISFNEVLENTKPRLLLDQVFDSLDRQLNRECVCRHLIECVSCFLPLENDPDNVNPKAIKHNMEALRRGDMDPGYDPIAEEKEAFMKKELERRAFVEAKKKREEEKRKAEAEARKKTKSQQKASSPGAAKAKSGKKAKAGAKAAAKANNSNAGLTAEEKEKKKQEEERKAAEEAERKRLEKEREEEEKRRAEEARIAKEKADWEAFNRPNRFHEEMKKHPDYNTLIQTRILPMWRSMKEPDTALTLCKLCALLHKIDNKVVLRYLLQCPRSSYAWLGLAKSTIWLPEALELACETLKKGAGQKPSLDRAVGFFVGRHIARCGSISMSSSPDDTGSSLIPLPLSRNLCQALLFALAQNMKKLYLKGTTIAMKEQEENPTANHAGGAAAAAAAVDNDPDAASFPDRIAGAEVLVTETEEQFQQQEEVPSTATRVHLPLPPLENLRTISREERKAQEAERKKEKEETATIQTYCCALFLLLRQSVFDDYNDLQTTGDFVREEQFVRDQIIKNATRKLELMPTPPDGAAAAVSTPQPKTPQEKKTKAASPKRGSPKKTAGKKKDDGKLPPLPKGQAWVERRHKPRLCRIHSLLDICMAHHAAALLVPFLDANAGIPVLLCAMLEEATIDLQTHVLSFGLLNKIIDSFEQNPGRGLLLSALCRLTAAIVVQDRRKDVYRSCTRFKKRISLLIFDAMEKYAHELKALALFGLLALASLFDNAKICFQAAAYVMRLYPDDKALQLASWACLLNASDYIYRVYRTTKNINSMHIQKRFLDENTFDAGDPQHGDTNVNPEDGAETITTQRQDVTFEDDEPAQPTLLFDEDGNPLEATVAVADLTSGVDIAPATPLADPAGEVGGGVTSDNNPQEANSDENAATSSSSKAQKSGKAVSFVEGEVETVTSFDPVSTGEGFGDSEAKKDATSTQKAVLEERASSGQPDGPAETVLTSSPTELGGEDAASSSAMPGMRSSSKDSGNSNVLEGGTAPGSSLADATGDPESSDAGMKTNLDPLPGSGSETASPEESFAQTGASSEKVQPERPYEIIDTEEERVEAEHYGIILEMSKCILKWLQKDDPHYIEEEKIRSELMCAQHEQDCDIMALMREFKRLEQLREELQINRAKQWNPPKVKHKTLEEEYLARLEVVFGEQAETARGKREITALLRRWPPNKYHVMYLEQCQVHNVPETEIEPEYKMPPPPLPQYERPIPKIRTVQWEYRKRMIDLYTRKGHLVRAENIDIEMLEYRGKEHLLYQRRCKEFEEHPLPVYTLKGAALEDAKPEPLLLVDDVEIQFLALSVMELLVTSTNRHDISVELRRIGERGLDHPVVLIDIASRSFLQVFNEAQARLDAEEKKRKHLEQVEHYIVVIQRLREEYQDVDEKPPDEEDDSKIRKLFKNCPEGEARNVFVEECKKFDIDPDDFEEALEEENEDSSSEEDEEEGEDGAGGILSKNVPT
ncbi:unnamed protein product, partial [Amoebophrya sp. A120]|eukprot:GSA120T00012684001.1